MQAHYIDISVKSCLSENFWRELYNNIKKIKRNKKTISNQFTKPSQENNTTNINYEYSRPIDKMYGIVARSIPWWHRRMKHDLCDIDL